MPVSVMDRLPLPNLKVYSAGSVAVLAVAVYHAVGVTSDPAWRANATLARAAAAAGAGEGAAEPAGPGAALDLAGPRNLPEQVVDVITFMMQEPLCMWTVINMCYCLLGVLGVGVQRAVFGPLRVAEAARVKEKLWNYVFYKFMFVFGVLNVQYMDEVLLWAAWFSLLGCLHLLATLAKDRFEYLSSSPRVANWAHARLVALLVGIVAGGAALTGVALAVGLPAGRHTFAFMAAECVLVVLPALHALARYSLQLYDAELAGPAYYTHLAFDAVSLLVELLHVVHMVWYSNLLVSMPSLVLLMQLRHLLHELQARLRKHRLYTALATHMSQHYPMASPEEVEKNQDNCAICWEPMKEARKLPCSHLFHNSCLCQWVQQDASCPTCRRALVAAPPAPPGPAPARAPRAPAPLAPLAGLAPLVVNAEPLPLPRPNNHPNHLFHFDGSRYVSWLPSFSVEVTRVRGPALSPLQLENMARQVQQLFPQYSVGALVEDLAATRSADATVDNILEGRLPAPPAPAAPPTPPPAPPVPHAPPTHATDPPVGAAPPAPSSADLMPPPEQLVYHVSEMSEAAGPSARAVSFSREAGAREEQLQRRKRELIAAARQRYLARHPPPPSAS